MPSPETIQSAFYLLSIVAMAFLVYRNWRGPQENTEKTDIELGMQLKQLQTDFVNLRDNHVHTLDLKIDLTNKAVQDLTIQLARLNTIIEERIPKKYGTQ